MQTQLLHLEGYKQVVDFLFSLGFFWAKPSLLLLFKLFNSNMQRVDCNGDISHVYQ